MKIKFTYFTIILASLLGLFIFANKDSKTSVKEKKSLKVLYVTHSKSTKHHDYVGQRQVFEDIATKQDWDYTVLLPDSKGLVNNLAERKDLAKGYDIVVYNFCVAGSANLQAASNIINQTKELHVDALLIHGAMHSFFPTYSNRLNERLGENASKDIVPVGISEGVADAKLIAQWKASNPNEEFPVWGDFCGAASEKHSRHVPVRIHKLMEHESAKSVVQDYTISKSEMYLNLYKTPNLIEILQGTVDEETSATVLWERPYTKASVMGLSLGHFLDEWKTPEFQALLVDSVEYLTN